MLTKQCNASVVLCIIAILCLASGCYTARSTSSTGLDPSKLAALLAQVDPWPGTQTNYSADSWTRLILAAEVVQDSRPQDVETAFYDYQLEGCIDGEFQVCPYRKTEEDTKLFLLLRVVFDIPEAVSNHGQQVTFFGPWVGRWMPPNGEISSDGHTINLCWPLKWQSGYPVLVSGWKAIQGVDARYNAKTEYRFLRHRYRMRDLSTFQMR
jgi:hypothetical protein